jgi:hypothetical protein
MNRYFELLHEVEDKLPAIYTNYIKHGSFYWFPRLLCWGRLRWPAASRSERPTSKARTRRSPSSPPLLLTPLSRAGAPRSPASSRCSPPSPCSRHCATSPTPRLSWSSSLTASAAWTSLTWGTVQVLPLRAQPAVGHRPHCGPWQGTLSRSFTQLWMDKGGSTFPLLERMTRGLQPPPPQPYHGRRPLRPLKPWQPFYHGRWRYGTSPRSGRKGSWW